MPAANPRRGRLLVALAIVAVGVVGFVAGRGSVDRHPEPRHSASGYAAGREAAFAGYDGGWSYDMPYIVTLRRGGPGVTYRFARRWPMRSGVAYRVCGRVVCERTEPP
jgi:hypothetical protein